MPQSSTLRVEGYRQFLTACDNADKDTKREVRKTFREVGDAVKAGAAARFAGTDTRTAAGFRTGVRRTGVSVQQSLRKTTGKHPEYGALQMRRALVPSLIANERETEFLFEQALDRVCDRFEKDPLMDYIVIKNVPPYDGRYELGIWSESIMTTREWGWMKKYAGYLPDTLVGADVWTDAETVSVLAIIALYRAGKIDKGDVPTVWERFADVPFGDDTFALEAGDREEADADGPPATSSTSNGASSSPSSRNDSDRSGSLPSPTGTPASDTSVSVPVTSGS